MEINTHYLLCTGYSCNFMPIWLSICQKWIAACDFNIYSPNYLFVKGKGLPQQAEVALGVPGRLSPPDLLNFRHYKDGRSSAKRTSRLYPSRNSWYSFSEAESTSGHMVLSEGTTEKIPRDNTGIDPGTVRIVVQCLNHYATQGPNYLFVGHPVSPTMWWLCEM